MLRDAGTVLWYLRRGAASALIRWPFENADRDAVLVYLDTDQDGNDRKIYDRLGFNRVGEAAWDSVSIRQLRYPYTHCHDSGTAMTELQWQGILVFL